MSKLTLTDDIVLKVASEPSLYEDCLFLQPMRDPALRLAMQLSQRGCSGCRKRALKPAIKALSGAFIKLVLDESHRTPNQLRLLKGRIEQITGGTYEEVLISYKDTAGQAAQMSF